MLAALAWRLPEPARDGQSRLEAGQRHIPGASEVEPGAGDVLPRILGVLVGARLSDRLLRRGTVNARAD